MSEIHTSIQQAIEKLRDKQGSRQAWASPRNHQRSHPAKTRAKEATGIFRAFRLSKPDQEIMEESKLVAAIEDRHAIGAYKVLRTRVLQRLRSHDWRRFIVTSASPGDGKTLTASNLALSISKDVNQSVFLVDLDLRRSSVAKYFGIEVKCGISDYLMGNVELDDLVHTPMGMDRIAIIPNTTLVEDASDLIASPRMTDFIEWLEIQSNRAIIIFDMPPALTCDDVLAFCPNVDAILFVVSQGFTKRASLDKAAELLANTDLLGVVLNRSQEPGEDGEYAYY